MSQSADIDADYVHAAKTAMRAIADNIYLAEMVNGARSTDFPITQLAVVVLHQIGVSGSLGVSGLKVPNGYRRRTVRRMMNTLEKVGLITLSRVDRRIFFNEPIYEPSDELKLLFERARWVPRREWIEREALDESLEQLRLDQFLVEFEYRRRRDKSQNLRRLSPVRDRLIARERAAIRRSYLEWELRSAAPEVAQGGDDSRLEMVAGLKEGSRWARFRQGFRRPKSRAVSLSFDIGAGINSATSDVDYVLNLMGPPPESQKSNNVPLPQLPVGAR
ncbi:hypothetical protein [Micromonospora sp. LOL_021]|uniref:hypothetical protein n=1 Tax=Micromonospora sp. LOL_021 TaxID=3345417 RepID=UPI003A860D0C